MSEMVERVARAIEIAMASDDNHPNDIARAAIEAMVEPTGVMLDAAYRCEVGSACIPTIFTAMIHAALTDTPQGDGE